jgi:hypothetical protein
MADSPYPRVRSDAPTPPDAPEFRPYRLEAASLEVASLFSEEEIAALHTDPHLQSSWRELALSPEETSAIRLIQRLHDWEADAAGNGAYSSQEEQRRAHVGSVLEVFVLQRAVRDAHKETLLWSPLLQEAIYDGLAAYDRWYAHNGDPTWEAECAQNDQRRSNYLSALAEWTVRHAGSEAAAELLRKLPESTRLSLFHRICERHPLLPGLACWLLETGETGARVLAGARTLSPEGARAIGEHLVARMASGAAPDRSSSAALRTLRQRGLWLWQPAAAELEALEARLGSAAPPWDAEDDLPLHYGEEEGTPGRQWARGSDAKREKESVLQIRLFLADQVDRGAPFPELGILAAGCDDFRSLAEWAVNSPWRDRQMTIDVMRLWDRDGASEERDFSDFDLAPRLAAEPEVVAMPEVREWLLGDRRPSMLLRLLKAGVWEGDEARLAFRRIAVLRPKSAAEYLRHTRDQAVRVLLRSDLAGLLGCDDAESRLAAIQFLGQMPEEVAPRPDRLPPAPPVPRRAKEHDYGSLPF